MDPKIDESRVDLGEKLADEFVEIVMRLKLRMTRLRFLGLRLNLIWKQGLILFMTLRIRCFLKLRNG